MRVLTRGRESKSKSQTKIRAHHQDWEQKSAPIAAATNATARHHGTQVFK